MGNYEKQNFVSGQILKAEHLNHIENGIGQLSEELQTEAERISEIVGGKLERKPVSNVSEWQTGQLLYGVDTKGNLSLKANPVFSYIRIDNIETYVSLDTTGPYPSVSAHPGAWLVTVCDADGKRVYGAADVVIQYNQQDSDRGEWYTSDETGMHIDIPALLAAYPHSGSIYLCKHNRTEFDWTYSTNSDGITKKVSEIDDRVTEVECSIEMLARIPEIVLPARMVAVVGHEFNMYFDNILVGEHASIEVTATITPSGITYRNIGECLRFIPTSDNVGSYTITITLRDEITREVLKEAACTLEVITDTALDGKKVLFIGDSLTDAGIYPAEIQHNLSHGGIVSLGTRSDTVTIDTQSLTVNHEGRSGWASYDYTRTGGTYREDVENAFWDGTAFNFGWYMSQQGYSGVDIVCINLGTNGVTNDNNRTTDAIDMMIESIHAYDPNVIVLVSLITPPASQEGWGMRVVGNSTAAKFRKDEIALIKKYKEKYEGKSNVDVTEVYIALDCDHDFPTITEAVSARNPTQIVRQNNNVHPSDFGYLKFADVYYNNILYHLTK